ncbi:MAG: hypothetical protein RR415_06595, partial [Ruthenibacterium sp.]
MNTKNKKHGKVVLSMMVLAAVIVTMMSTTLTAYAYNKLVSSPDLDGYSASVTASQSGSTETFTCASKRRYPVKGDPNAKTEYLWEKNEHAGDWRYWYAVNGATTESHSVGITTTNSGGQHEYRCRVDAFSTAVYEYIDDAYVAILGRHGEKGGIDAWGNLLISHNQITHMRGTVVTNPENILITNEVASMAAALFFSQEWLIDSGRAYNTWTTHGGFPLYQYDYRHMPFNEAF